jgi:hypothetical protein
MPACCEGGSVLAMLVVGGLAAYCEQRTGTGVCDRPGKRATLLQHV